MLCVYQTWVEMLEISELQAPDSCLRFLMDLLLLLAIFGSNVGVEQYRQRVYQCEGPRADLLQLLHLNESVKVE
jgi:hypothetical protein